MNHFPLAKNRMLAIFPAILSKAEQASRSDLVNSLQDAEERLRTGRLLVVVCGEFKQGKSSLLNALLEVDELFPTDVDLATNLVSMVRHGVEPRYLVQLAESNEEAPRELEIQRGEIADYVTEAGNPGNRRGVRLLTIELPHRLLEGGLVLVDTPGVGGLNSAHTETTLACLGRADVALYVTDVFRTLAQTDLDFIRQRLAGTPVINVVTKVDLSPCPQAVVAGNLARLSEFVHESATIQVVPVSSHLRDAYRRGNATEDLVDSNFPELERTLGQLLDEERGRLLLGRAATQIAHALAQLRRPLECRLEACQRRSQDELDGLERRAAAATDRQRELSGPDAPWRLRMRDAVADWRGELPRLLQESLQGLRREGERLLDDPKLVRERTPVITAMEQGLRELATGTRGQLVAAAERLRSDLSRATGLDFDPYEIGALELRAHDPAADLARLRNPNWLQKGTQVLRQSTSLYGMLGVGLFFVTGGAAPAALALAGTAGLLANNAQEVVRDIRDRSRAELLRVVERFLDGAARALVADLMVQIKELERVVRDDLDERLRCERECCERELAQIRETRRLTDDQARTAGGEINASLGELQRLELRLQELSTSLVEAGRETPGGGATAAPRTTSRVEREGRTSRVGAPSGTASPAVEARRPGANPTPRALPSRLSSRRSSQLSDRPPEGPSAESRVEATEDRRHG